MSEININFDYVFYTEYYNDLTSFTYEDALKHWELFGLNEGRFCSKEDFLKENNVDINEIPENFNAEIYFELNPDLYPTNKYDAMKHYILWGRHEGRLFNHHDSNLLSVYENQMESLDAELKNEPVDFDYFFYTDYYNDISNLNYEGANKHWLTSGCKEKRFPNLLAMLQGIGCDKNDLPSDFVVEDYLHFNPDVENLYGNSKYRVIRHYLERGKREQRAYKKTEVISSIKLADILLKQHNYPKALQAYIEASLLDTKYINNIYQVIDKIDEYWLNQRTELIRMVKEQIRVNSYSPDWCYIGLKLNCLDSDIIGELIISLCKQNKSQEALGWIKILSELKNEDEKITFYKNRFLSSHKISISETNIKIVQAAKHTVSVDIVICVHNALYDVQLCLNSILQYTNKPYSIIIVNDGSNDETSDWLRSFGERNKVKVIYNQKAKGYTFAANQGLRASSAELVVLLNSDTVVTKGWIDKFSKCAFSNSKIGIVGPLSNTASWQSIPEICNDEGDWAENKIPENKTIEWMGKLVESYSGGLYPRLPILNGFCLVIKRELINSVGIFDEITFGKGFGEENDLCLRAKSFGWELAVADDTYIYHSQSKSYGNEKRARLCEHADKQLKQKHTEEVVHDAVIKLRYDLVMEGIRARSQVLFSRAKYVEDARNKWGGKKIAFILPATTASGGCHVVFRDAITLNSMGIDVSIVNFQCNQDVCEYYYPNVSHLMRYVNTPDDIANILNEFDAIVATLFISVYWMNFSPEFNFVPRRAYYIQDFEPMFFDAESEEYKLAWDSYSLYPDLIRFTKTSWNQKMVTDHIGVSTHLVGSSVDIDTYRPRTKKDGAWPDRKIRVLAMIRPATPYRGAKMTMDVLKNIYDNHIDLIEIYIFGCEINDVSFSELEQDFMFYDAGILNKFQVSSLMNECDIFFDGSSFQAMGLTAMEAMATGLAVIAPISGGASSFITNRKNGLLVDTSDILDCVRALSSLITDHEFRDKIQRNAIYDICAFFPEKCAYNILSSIFEDTNSYQL